MDDKSGNVKAEKQKRQRVGETEFPATFVCILMRTPCASACMPAAHVKPCLSVCANACCCHLFSLVVHHDGHPFKLP